MNQPLNQQIHPTVCPLDCPDTCSLSVTVTDNTITQIRGSHANPYTDGAICSKVVKYYPEFVHGKTRLTHPLKRSGEKGSGQYQRISWDEALDHVYQGFSQAIEQYGAETVLGFNYAGPHGVLADASMDRRFFNKIGATQLNRGPLCGGVRGGAYSSLFGNTPGMPPEQAEQADLIIIWGNNATVSNLHLGRVAKKAAKQGAKLIVIDPKRIAIADHATCYLAIQPGTDVILAMALAAELEKRDALDHSFIDQWVDGFDAYMTEARRYTVDDVVKHCQLSKAEFDAFIELYINADKVALSIGNGMERGKSGGSAIRAICALPAITGHFGRLGDGVIAKAGFAFPRSSERLEASHLLPDNTRIINIVDIGKALLDETLAPPIKALMIYNHNPLATHPDQNRMRRALSQEDLFIVGCDVVMTDSMAYADIILPAASVFEIEDIYTAYGQTWLQRAEAIIPCVGEALPNTEIFRRLAARFGFTEDEFTATDKQLMDEAFIDDDPRLGGYKPSQIPVDQSLPMNSIEGDALIMCDTVKPNTASGKIELYSEALEQQYGYGVPRYTELDRNNHYPFVIISPSSNKRTNATFGGCDDSLQTEQVEIHPEDAKQYGINDGVSVKVWNEQGEVSFIAKVSDKVKRGVLYTPKGAWQASSSTGQTVNALMSADKRTDILDGACYNDTFVDIAAQ